eukprot:2235185-Amphidinium_carterae.1
MRSLRPGLRHLHRLRPELLRMNRAQVLACDRIVFMDLRTLEPDRDQGRLKVESSQNHCDGKLWEIPNRADGTARLVDHTERL